MSTNEFDMNFDVVFILTLYDESRRHFTSGHRKTKTPFPPFAGLEILNQGIGFGVIKKVSWDEDSNLFRCYLEYEVDPSNSDDDIQFQIEMAKQGGFSGFEKIYETPENS